MSASASALQYRDQTGLDPAATGDPFVRVRFRHGMLLGAEDLTVEQRSTLLRQRLHQAMLHGAGTVWGLRVGAQTTSAGERELTVAPGLALDLLGREIYVPSALCLRLRGVLRALRWADLDQGSLDSQRRVYVVLRHASATSQPVPALIPPGALAADALATSRVEDRYRVDLVAQAPQDPGTQLLSLLGRQGALPSGREILSLRDALVEWVTAEAGQLPALWEQEPDVPLLLAAVELARDDQGEARVVEVDNRVRPLCPSLPLLLDQALGLRLGTDEAQLRCRLRRVAVRREGTMAGLDLEFTAPVDRHSLGGVRLLQLGEQGWERVSSTIPLSSDSRRLRLLPSVALAEGKQVQLLLPGQGEGPVLDTGGQPLAGWWDDPTPGSGRGLDASWVGTWTEVG